MHKKLQFLFLFGFLSSTMIGIQSFAQPGPNPITLTIVSSDTGKGFKLSWSAVPSQALMPGDFIDHYLVRREPKNSVSEADSISFVPIDTARGLFQFADYPPSPSPKTGYIYMVRAKSNVGMYFPSNLIYVPFAATAVESEFSEFPMKYILHQNYPNPFNPTTTIHYQLPASSEVKLTVFDMLGREITTLVNGSASAGIHTVEFNASALPSGVYFYRLQAGFHSDIRKLTILK